MTTVATLEVEINGKDTGVDALLSKLEARLKTLDTSAKAKDPLKPVGDSARQATPAVLTLAQAEARLLSTQGDLPGAAARISSALGQNTGNTLQNIRAKTQLAQIENRISGQSQTLTDLFKGQASTVSSLGQQLSALGGQAGSLAGSIGNLAGSLGTLGTAGAAIGIVKVGLDIAVAGGKILATRDSFDSLAKSVGTTGDALLTGLRAAAQGTVSDADLIASANSGILLTSGKLASDLPRLLEIARASSKATGEEVGFVFDSLVKGIARGSPQIIDNAKITLDAAGAFQTYADSIGKTPDQLSRAEQQQATLNAVLLAGNDIIKQTGGSAVTASTQIAQGQVAITNLKDSLSGLVAIQVGPFAADMASFATALQSPGLGSAGGAISGLFDVFQRIQPQIQLFQQLSGAVDTAGGALGRFAGIQIPDGFSPLKQSAQDWLNLLGLAPAAANTAASAVATSTAAMTAGAVSTNQGAGAYAAYVAAANAGGAAATAAAGQINFSAQAMALSAEKSVIATATQQAQAAATAALTQQTNTAVSSFLALNPSIDGAGIAAAVAAGKIPALIGQLAGLRIAAYSARDAVAALAAQQAINTRVLAVAGPSSPGRTSGKNNDIDKVFELQKANADAAEARANQIRTIGTQQEQVNQAEKDYAAAVKASGAQSAAAINAETKLKQERIAAAKADDKAAKKAKGGGGGGGGGGTTKLTDQQKLNNSLLSSQESFQSKSEAAEQAHLDKLASINADFNEKMKKAQDSFSQSQLDGRAGFYDTLGSIEDQGLRTALAAEYEAAFQEADKIATEKGADVGQKFLEAKQAAIQAQGQRASEIAEATKSGDKDKAAYLAGVDKLYREAEARKLEAIKSGEGSVASERDAAIAAESDNYGAAQEKIGTAADQAAARKVLAAERAGQAVDAEGLKVDALTSKYDALGQAGARAGVAPSAVAATTPPAPTDSTQPPSAAQTNDAIAAAIASLKSAINAVEGAVKGGAEKITGAVKSIPRSVT